MTDTNLNLENMIPQRHWLGFDVFVYAFPWPGYPKLKRHNPLGFNPDSEFAKFFSHEQQPYLAKDFYPTLLDEFK